MTIPLSTAQTYTFTGSAAEDVQNIIYRTEQEDTPFLSRAKRMKATAVLHQWQTEGLDTVDGANKQVQGDTYVRAAVLATTKVGNYLQISNKVYGVAGTMQAIDKYGYKSEMARQKVLKGISLKRDMENILFANTASSAGNSTTAATIGGLKTWLATNVSRGTGGSNGGYSGGVTTVATDGTQRPFTEDLLKAVIKLMADTGAKPRDVFLGSWNKQKFSGFTGNATRYIDADNKLSANINLYESDFGTMRVTFSPQSPTRDAFVLDFDRLGVAFLRNMETVDIAKISDSDSQAIQCEYTLFVGNEKSQGVIADLTTS